MTSIRLVPFTATHKAAFAETILDPDVLRFTGTPDPTPEGWADAWMRRYRDEQDRYNFAIIDADETFSGYAVAFSVDREDLDAELGYAVSPWARGRGVATDALDALTTWAFGEGLYRVSLLIAVSNTASSRVAEKAGYTLEGVLRSMHQKNGRREDMQSWSKLATDGG
ncbi:MAG: GNAT family N-acetyltransferase [Actinomycetota bacterium]|nr:GNAT family N-acetyltransferase [Actinomycetota bacterium]